MNFPVIRAEGYTLVHAAGLIGQYSAVARETLYRKATSPFLTEIKDSLRSFDQVVAYPPNQVYIGEMQPEQLRQVEMPWYHHPLAEADRFGQFGEIMPLEEFIGLIKTADVFDLIRLEKNLHRTLKNSCRNIRCLANNALPA
jgi:glycine/sarcosine/betaine reductase complex component C subunit beta